MLPGSLTDATADTNGTLNLQFTQFHPNPQLFNIPEYCVTVGGLNH